ncbi:peptidoglycan-binding domain-containing protein [Streptomyces adelaidensis]|uniref:peptidoglycan-binding domain-containing protein n=1 Tax=Streptomyces adelaidensis TaxID=2796465 RepID=UPI0027DBFAC4|nr:peptidoglycan-binding domain-containing protein [Streptomyces adelaidensis]
MDPFRTQRSPSPAAEATGAARASGAGGPAGATTTVLAPFEDDAFASSPSPSPASSARRDRRRRRRRTGIIVALAGTAAAGVMAAAGFMSGLFSYDAPERDGALPDDLRASAPDTSADGDASPVEPSEEDAAGAPAPAPTGEAPPPSPTPTPSSSPSPTRSSASPSASPDPTRSSPSASASGGSSAAGSEESDSRLVVPKTLRAGDDDPEVTELQLRLRQLDFYNGDIDENYNSQVELAVCAYQESRNITKGQEEPGVYGPVTRERLESETKEP